MRRLGEADRKRLLEYVGREPEMNLFFFGDIENYGLESETVSAYALSDGANWDCVLLEYFDMYLFYSQREDFQIGEVTAFLRSREIRSISGKAELIRQFQPYYPEMRLSETYMCRCNRAALQAVSPKGEAGMNDRTAVGNFPENTVELRPMTEKDVREIVALYQEIEEFAHTYGDPEKAQKELEVNFACGELVVGAFENGTLAAIAGTSGSNSRSAMLVGVATRPGFRKKGYATAVVREVCRRSFLDGKEFLCLFYDNPEAGRIYRGMGFEEIGLYDMLR